MKNGVTTGMRRTARIIGTLVLVLIVAMAVGKGVPNPLQLSLGLTLLGLVVACKWAGVGGALIFGGFTCFALVNHGIKMNTVFAPLLIGGLLYLLCWWRTCKRVISAHDELSGGMNSTAGLLEGHALSWPLGPHGRDGARPSKRDSSHHL
ncbi:MAG: hypothetical protein ABSH21_04360 [Verrucomicrobiia bacterium]